MALRLILVVLESSKKNRESNNRKTNENEKINDSKAKTPTATPTPASKRRRIEPSPFCSIPTGDDKTTLVFFANSKQGLLEIFHDDIRDMNQKSVRIDMDRAHSLQIPQDLRLNIRVS